VGPEPIGSGATAAGQADGNSPDNPKEAIREFLSTWLGTNRGKSK
jgi:hypothetical protein